MLNKPRLKTFLTVFPVADNVWGLRGSSEELWKIKLHDEEALQTFGLLLPYLDGRRTVGEIREAVAQRGGDPERAAALLEQLYKAGLVEESAQDLLPPEELGRFRDQISFFSRFTSAGGAKLQSLLRQSRVGLIGDGVLGRSVLRHLEVSGFGEVVVLGGSSRTPLDRERIWPSGSEERPPQLFIFAQEAHDPLLLEAMDSFSKANDIPWLLVRAVDAKEGWVGPLFIPGETASYLSLEARLRGHMPYFNEHQAFDGYLREMGKPAAPAGGLNVAYDLLSAIAVAELVKLVTGFSMPQLAGRFLIVNFLNWETEIHHVLRVPRLERVSHAQPRAFPWKEIPYGDSESRRA